MVCLKVTKKLLIPVCQGMEIFRNAISETWAGTLIGGSGIVRQDARDSRRL